MANTSQTRINDTPRCAMVCVVPKQNVEVLGRALHALAKIGEELYVEPVETGLTFRTVHANHSVYAEVHFLESFFAFYQNPAKQQGSRSSSSPDDDEDSLKCRITMKSCVAAFRSLVCLRKQVETCLLQIEPTWLTVKFRCHHNLVRSHRLPVIECESLQANYADEEIPNNLAIGPSTFASVIKNFQCSEKDITLAVDSERAVLKNFVPGGTDPKVRSSLKLEKGEFASFKVTDETAITFCLKAFRAVLFFSEPAEYPLNIKFSTPGSPVIVINTAPMYELRFVLSSLPPEDCDVSRTHSQQMLTPLRSIERSRKVRASRPASSDTDPEQERPSDSALLSDSTSQHVSDRLAAPGATPGASSSRRERQVDPSQRPVHRASASQRSVHTTDSQQCPSTAGASVGTAVGAHVLNWAGRPGTPEQADAPIPVPVPSGLHWGIIASRTSVPESDEDEGDEADKADDEAFVPGTPPLPQAKRARLYFQRCFEPTLNATALLDHTVLAEDSD